MISLAKYEFNQNKRKVLSFMLIIVVIANIIIFIPKDLKIYFIDQTTPNMIQRLNDMFERNPLISKEI